VNGDGEFCPEPECPGNIVIQAAVGAPLGLASTKQTAIKLKKQRINGDMF